MPSIIRRSNLDGGEARTIGFPWESYELAAQFSSYMARMGRGKWRYWVESNSAHRDPVAKPRKRALLKDEQT